MLKNVLKCCHPFNKFRVRTYVHVCLFAAYFVQCKKIYLIKFSDLVMHQFLVLLYKIWNFTRNSLPHVILLKQQVIFSFTNRKVKIWEDRNNILIKSSTWWTVYTCQENYTWREIRKHFTKWWWWCSSNLDPHGQTDRQAHRHSNQLEAIQQHLIPPPKKIKKKKNKCKKRNPDDRN